MIEGKSTWDGESGLKKAGDLPNLMNAVGDDVQIDFCPLMLRWAAADLRGASFPRGDGPELLTSRSAGEAESQRSFWSSPRRLGSSALDDSHLLASSTVSAPTARLSLSSVSGVSF